jgi:anti-sigma B factor antagonist
MAATHHAEPPGQLTVLVRHDRDAAFVTVTGELDLLTAPQLSAALDEVRGTNARHIAIDLTETTFMDSLGIHTLVQAQQHPPRRHVAVICGPGPVMQALELLDLTEPLNVVSSLNEYKLCRSASSGAQSPLHRVSVPRPGGIMSPGSAVPMNRPADHATLGRSLRPRGPLQLALSTWHGSEATVVTVTGELDVLTARRLMPQLDDIVRRHQGDAVIDLSQAEFIDSFGLTVLLNTQRRLARQGRNLTVICGEGPVRRAIEFARLIESLGVVPSLAEYNQRRASA